MGYKSQNIHSRCVEENFEREGIFEGSYGDNRSDDFGKWQRGVLR
jgi:hypothetical protein